MFASTAFGFNKSEAYMPNNIIIVIERETTLITIYRRSCFYTFGTITMSENITIISKYR